MNEPSSGRLAGSDTREASATRTVRFTAISAGLLAGPAWAVVFGSRGALERLRSIPDALGSALPVVLIGAGLAGAILAWRLGFPEQVERKFPPGSGALALIVALAAVALARGSIDLAAWFLPLVPAISGWFFGRAARIAAAACVPQVTPAAIGIITTAAILGAIFASPLVAVTGGSGIRWGAGWTLVLAGLAGLYHLRAHLALPEDRDRSQARAVAHAVVGSNHRAVAFQCEGVAVSFESTAVLRGADLQARAGELVALVGANGAGKSTLLRTAAGFVECRAGRVTVGGHDISMLRPEERAELGLTFVSGARPIFPDLTVLENLRVAAFRSHLGNRSFAAATEAIFDLAPALHARRRERAGVLSGGEQRLLAVAQTLYRRPIALLADELTLGLASDARISVLDLLRLLADGGVAVVAVDHDLVSLLPRAHRAVLLSDGLARSFEDPVSLLDQRSSLLPATFLAQVPR